MSNLAKLESKSQQFSKQLKIAPSGESVWAAIGISTAALKSMKPGIKRANYIAIKHWLTQYKPPSETPVEQIKAYLQVLNHLCQVQAWEAIKLILKLPIRISAKNKRLPLPLSEYLFFQAMIGNVLEASQEIINHFPNIGDEIFPIVILKARALSKTGKVAEASDLLKKIQLQSVGKLEIFIEATAYLGFLQVNVGLYKEGMSNLQNALKLIEEHFSLDENLKYLDLKIDILEKFAFYEMNSSKFAKAAKTYETVIDLRNQYNLIHKLISPSVHQGVLLRRLGKYKQAVQVLSAAKEQAVEIGNPNDSIWIDHHLAYVLLNQGNNLELAKKLCNSSLEGYKRLEDGRGVSDAYQQLGFINLAQSKFEEAEHNFEKSLIIRRSINNRHGLASSVLDLGLVSWHQKKYYKFIKLFLKGFVLYARLGILNHVRFYRMLKLGYTWIIGARNWTA